MKKLFTVLFTILISMSFVKGVSAKSEQDLIDYVSQTFTIAGKEVSRPDVVAAVKSYLADHELSSSEVDKIIADCDNIISLANKENVTDITKLSKSTKDTIKNYVSDIASIADVYITYDSSAKDVKVVGKDNNKNYGEYSLSKSNDKLVATGKDYTLCIASSGLVILGLVLLRKLKVND